MKIATLHYVILLIQSEQEIHISKPRTCKGLRGLALHADLYFFCDTDTSWLDYKSFFPSKLHPCWIASWLLLEYTPGLGVLFLWAESLLYGKLSSLKLAL